MDYTLIPFDSIFQFIFKLFDTLMVSAHLIWAWFSEPIDPTLAEFLDIPLDTINLELLFGTMLIAAIVMAAVKLFSPLS